MGLQISPDIIRRHFGARSIYFCPDARIERLIRGTIQEADEQGFNGIDLAAELYGAGTRYGDLLVLLRVDRSHPEWMAAARRTGRRVPRLLANPSAREALHDQSGDENRGPRELLDVLVPTAVLLALTRRSEPQRIRLNRDYVKDRHGAIASKAPIDPWLSVAEFERWLLKEARNALEAILLAQAYPRTARDPVDDALPIDGEHCVRESHAEYGGRAISAEDSDRRQAALEMLEKKLSPRQQELYGLLRANPDATSADLGERLGMAPATVRVHQGRIREKARELLAAM